MKAAGVYVSPIQGIIIRDNSRYGNIPFSSKKSPLLRLIFTIWLRLELLISRIFATKQSLQRNDLR
jgi:hypothetical protein